MEVIDFDRLNYLCADRNDPSEGMKNEIGMPILKYQVTRTILKEMVKVYNEYMMSNKLYTPPQRKFEYILATLRFNKILVNPDKVKRNNKIKEILDEGGK